VAFGGAHLVSPGALPRLSFLFIIITFAPLRFAIDPSGRARSLFLAPTLRRRGHNIVVRLRKVENRRSSTGMTVIHPIDTVTERPGHARSRSCHYWTLGEKILRGRTYMLKVALHHIVLVPGAVQYS
jgi:hypothetical protein